MTIKKYTERKASGADETRPAVYSFTGTDEVEAEKRVQKLGHVAIQNENEEYAWSDAWHT